MKVRVIGGGWYGCHLAAALLDDGHAVELHEQADNLFRGASGANPARLHKGFHYPRSALTRAACRDHADRFMATYGRLTRTIACNVYAVAAHDSQIDFGTYRKVMAGEADFVVLETPKDLGLANIEGAVLTGERHIVIDQARQFFLKRLDGHVHFGRSAGQLDDPQWDVTIDCTFCALDGAAIDRFEPCVTALVKGPTDRAVTIMDGPFPSLYPWNPGLGLSSVTSAKLTPLSKTCTTYADAKAVLERTTPEQLEDRCEEMLDSLAWFWPASRDLYRFKSKRTAIRAMPRSGADARLVDVDLVAPRVLRVRAGKIDAIFRAEDLIKEALCSPSLALAAA